MTIIVILILKPLTERNHPYEAGEGSGGGARVNPGEGSGGGARVNPGEGLST